MHVEAYQENGELRDSYFTFQITNNKGADQTAQMGRLVCTFVVCKQLSHGNIKRKICTEKRLNTSLKDLSLALTNHGRHGLFSFLSSLPISVLRNLELEANKLYDRANKLYKAALLTRCYVQHFLSPYIDSEVNHKRHFIKIPFINKGIEFIDLHSIFKDNSVISSIPNYFNNSETPIICYKYNKPIRSTIFNFNKIVNDLDIDSNTPAS